LWILTAGSSSSTFRRYISLLYGASFLALLLLSLKGAEELAETKQSGHVPTAGPQIKDGTRSAKDGSPDRLRCGLIQKKGS